MQGPCAALLPDGRRLHLQHGPIDLVITAEGDRDRAFRAAMACFAGVLDALVAELALLRQPVGPCPQGPVARRMHAATLPHAARHFITPMAAVAGAVAEEVLAAMLEATPLSRAFVNNGGDIALHLAPGTRARISVAGPRNQSLGSLEIGAEDAVRGIATSGQGGRSLSFGIADAVTVLGASAAVADAAATLIANAVDLPGHPGIRREVACTLQPDSDLGHRRVVTGVGPLSERETALALDRGLAEAGRLVASGHVAAAALFLNGASRATGHAAPLARLTARRPAHA